MLPTDRLLIAAGQIIVERLNEEPQKMREFSKLAIAEARQDAAHIVMARRDHPARALLPCRCQPDLDRSPVIGGVRPLDQAILDQPIDDPGDSAAGLTRG